MIKNTAGTRLRIIIASEQLNLAGCGKDYEHFSQEC